MALVIFSRCNEKSGVEVIKNTCKINYFIFSKCTFAENSHEKRGRRYLKNHIGLLRVEFFHIPESSLEEAGIKRPDLSHFISVQNY